MRTLGAAFALVVGLAAVALPAEANGRHGAIRSDFHGSRRFDGRHFDGHRFRGFDHGIGLFVAPSVVVASPVVVTPLPVYAPPVFYGPPPVPPQPPAYAPTAYPPVAASSMPRVVEFPTGRYELRGDGVYAPYVWVWIPNPPAAPPPPPPPTAPPPGAPAASPGPGSRSPVSRTVMLYRWTDEHGVTTWTDSIDKVPAHYRGQVGRLAP
jgi:hypothetical protein